MAGQCDLAREANDAGCRASGHEQAEERESGRERARESARLRRSRAEIKKWLDPDHSQ